MAIVRPLMHSEKVKLTFPGIEHVSFRSREYIFIIKITTNPQNFHNQNILEPEVEPQTQYLLPMSQTKKKKNPGNE